MRPTPYYYSSDPRPRYTNFEDVNGRRISVPKTAHVTEKRETNVPLKSMIGIKEYIDHVFPSLKPLGINSTKLCCQSPYPDSTLACVMIQAT